MNTNNLVVGTAAVVVAGRWAQDKPLNIGVVVGGGFLALGLAFLNEASPVLASRFAILVFVVATFMYVPAIAKSVGLTRKAAKW